MRAVLQRVAFATVRRLGAAEGGELGVKRLAGGRFLAPAEGGGPMYGGEPFQRVGGSLVAEIGPGLLVYLGVAKGDSPAAAEYLAKKVATLRLFPGEGGRMDRNVQEATGSVLVVSQFTLQADCRKGRRPDFAGAAAGEEAEPLYRHFAACLAEQGLRVGTGVFGADMAVESVNDGPVTVLLDSGRLF